MPSPEVPNSILTNTQNFTPNFSSQITFGPAQQPNPNPTVAEHSFKIRSPPVTDPKSSINNEPRTRQSLRCALHLGDNFFRHRARGFFITREVH